MALDSDSINNLISIPLSSSDSNRPSSNQNKQKENEASTKHQQGLQFFFRKIYLLAFLCDVPLLVDVIYSACIKV